MHGSEPEGVASASGPPPGRLHRALSRWDGIAVAVGSVIGVGIFRTTGQVYRGAGGAGGALAIWVGLGLLSLCGSFVYADLATRVPEAGGPYAYVREGFGRVPAFVDGWITLAAGNPSLTAPGVAILGELLARLLGGASPRAWALVTVVALTVVNGAGVKAGALTQKILTLFKLVALGGLILLAFLPARAAGAATAEALPPAGSATLLLALSGAWYAYVGWQDGALLAEDLRAPRRDLPAVLIGSVAIVVTTYVAVNAAVLYAARGTTLAATDLPALAIAQQRLGSWAERLMTIVVLVSMLGGSAEGIMVHPRIGFALARDRMAPRLLGLVNRGGTPWAALLFNSGIVAALVATGSFEDIVKLLVFTQALQAVLEASSYFLVRRRVPGPQWTPLHPFLPALFVGANAALAVWVAVQDPMRVLAGMAVLLAATMAYLLYRLLE